MKKLLTVCLLLSYNAVKTAAARQEVMVEQVEIVVVQAQRVLGSLDEAKEEIEKLQKSLHQQEQELERAKQELGKKVQSFQAAEKTMAPKVRETKEQELQQEAMRLQEDLMEFERQKQEADMKIHAKYLEKIQSFCRKQGWKIVLPVALYVAPEFDKTDEVITALNKEYKRKQEEKKAKDAQAKAVKKG